MNTNMARCNFCREIIDDDSEYYLPVEGVETRVCTNCYNDNKQEKGE